MELKNCGNVFLTQEGMTIFECTLCPENTKFRRIEKFGRHVIENHFTPLDEEDGIDLMPAISDILPMEDALKLKALMKANFGATEFLTKTKSNSKSIEIERSTDEQYDKQCGEVHLTKMGLLIFQCTLCEMKYEGVLVFSQHIVREHYNAEILTEVQFELYTDEESVAEAMSTEHLEEEDDNADGDGEGEVGRDDGGADKKDAESDASSESIINYGRSANSRIPDRHSDVEEEIDETKKSKRPVGKWRQFFNVIIWPETNEKRFKCKKCGTVIRDASNVHHHITRVHEKLRPYKCDECKREFHSRTELIIHNRKHTGERPYLCVECGVAFISASDLHRHRQQNHVVHVRDKKCSICGKAFLQKRDLQRHRRSVHSEERPFECNVCGACFKLRSTLRTHMRIHEDKRQYKCNLCDASYNYKSILDSHMKRKHALAHEKTI